MGLPIPLALAFILSIQYVVMRFLCNKIKNANSEGLKGNRQLLVLFEISI